MSASVASTGFSAFMAFGFQWPGGARAARLATRDSSAAPSGPTRGRTRVIDVVPVRAPAVPSRSARAADDPAALPTSSAPLIYAPPAHAGQPPRLVNAAQPPGLYVDRDA